MRSNGRTTLASTGCWKSRELSQLSMRRFPRGQKKLTIMAIDIMDTEIGVKLRKVRSLSNAAIWYDSMDGNVRRLILKWIQNDQLRSRGVDEFNDVIGYYSQTTHNITNGKKAFNTHYTLEDTGEFFRQMFVIVLRDSLVIDSDGADKVGDDGSTMNLFTEHGVGIVGLNDENMAKLVQILRQKYIAKARQMLGID